MVGLEAFLGGAGGTIPGVETSGTLEDFEVFAVEAVIADTGPTGPAATIPPAPGE